MHVRMAAPNNGNILKYKDVDNSYLFSLEVYSIMFRFVPAVIIQTTKCFTFLNYTKLWKAWCKSNNGNK